MNDDVDLIATKANIARKCLISIIPPVLPPFGDSSQIGALGNDLWLLLALPIFYRRPPRRASADLPISHRMAKGIASPGCPDQFMEEIDED